MRSNSYEERELVCSLLLRLQHATQALAQTAEIQLSLFPDFVCKADELALAWDHWWLCVKSHSDVVLTDEQRRLLEAIDCQLAEMSGPQNAELWTEDALRSHPAWGRVRHMARAALDALGWPDEAPPEQIS